MNSTDRERLFKQLSARQAALALPIDFEQLERTGLLARRGSWYRLKCVYGKLPWSIRERILEVAFDGVEGMKVRF
jgi:hypothetical protein